MSSTESVLRRPRGRGGLCSYTQFTSGKVLVLYTQILQNLGRGNAVGFGYRVETKVEPKTQSIVTQFRELWHLGFRYQSSMKSVGLLSPPPTDPPSASRLLERLGGNISVTIAFCSQLTTPSWRAGSSSRPVRWQQLLPSLLTSPLLGKTRWKKKQQKTILLAL